MNERIDFLVDKTADLMPGVCNIEYESGKLGVEFTEDALEKFVELLIGECSELTLDYYNNDHYRGWLDYREEIRKHFGIKE